MTIRMCSILATLDLLVLSVFSAKSHIHIIIIIVNADYMKLLTLEELWLFI